MKLPIFSKLLKKMPDGDINSYVRMASMDFEKV
jgi:hypothetical protein